MIGINKKLKLKSSDTFVSITTISFDIYEAEIWLSLANGLTIVYADEEECINSKLLSKLCLKNNVNIFQSTPTKTRMLLNQTKSNNYFKKFDKMIFSGECLDNNLLSKLRRITNSNIYDAYAPTETTIWSTIADITKEKISTGKPINNTKVWVLDKKHRVLPLMVKGELGISGDSVSKGYFENNEKTKKSFVDTDFIQNKVYLTGDYSIINKDLNVEILNRIDYQIKLNGQRIELEEIESLILNNKKIKDVCICLKDSKYLVCFYSLKDKENKFIDGEIKKYLEKKLPIYMVPKVFIMLDELPYTLNNKKDRKKINSIEVDICKLNKFEQDFVRPKTKIQMLLYKAFKKVINVDFGINTSISSLNLDSLDAIKVQTELLKNNIKINYTDILRCDTIEKLCKFIECGNVNNKLDYNYYEKLDQEFREILNTNYKLENNKLVKNKKIENVILTGVTGFLGIHILDEVMKRSKNSKVYCIIRNKDGVTAKDRLISKLKYYFDGRYIEDIGKRIIILNIDISNINELYSIKSTIENVNLFIHTAACVKHYGLDEYFKNINVYSTENIAKFCFENKIKLIHSSTLSVSGNGFDIGINNNNISENNFDEKSLYIGQTLENVYVRTKFEAECVILSYVKKGLDAKIIRYGNLVNRSYDLKFQDNLKENAFLDRIKYLLEYEIVPESVKDIYLEFTPVDLASIATLKIASDFNDKRTIFHLYDNNHIDIYEFINFINNNFDTNIKFVKNKDFADSIKKIITSEDAEILTTILQDVDSNYNINYKSNISVKCDNTIEYLKKLGFVWDKIDEQYIKKYIEYFIKIGYIKVEVKK